MKEQVNDGREPVHFMADVRESLGCAATNQERIDVLDKARKHADRQWFHWNYVRKYIKSQLDVIEIEAQLELPFTDS